MNFEPENGGRMRKNTTETRRWNSLSWFDAIPLWRLRRTEDSLDGLYHLQVLRPFQIFDRLVRSDDNGVARCTTALRRQSGVSLRKIAVAPNVRLLAKTNLVLHSPFELEVHWYSKSKDSDIYDGPISTARVSQRWRLGEGYKWQLLVTVLRIVPISVS